MAYRKREFPKMFGGASYPPNTLLIIDRLVEAFYLRMETLPEAATVRAMHAEDLSPTKIALKQYLCEWTGGPKLYTPAKGHPKLRQRLHRIKVPTLLLWGVDDRFVAAANYGAAYRDAIPGARLETIDRAGHFPHLEQPEALVERIRAFFGERRA